MLSILRRIIEIAREIISAIKEIVTKYKVGYSDIAILFPFKENRTMNYYFMHWLTDAMDNEETPIPYSFITQPLDAGQNRVQVSRTTGVVVSTIDSSLGLDFKAVIVAGLFPYNYYYSDEGKKELITSWNQIGKMSAQEQETVQVQIRKMYTACSRARDILYVISDLNAGTPMEKILIESKEK